MWCKFILTQEISGKKKFSSFSRFPIPIYSYVQWWFIITTFVSTSLYFVCRIFLTSNLKHYKNILELGRLLTERNIFRLHEIFIFMGSLSALCFCISLQKWITWLHVDLTTHLDWFKLYIAKIPSLRSEIYLWFNLYLEMMMLCRSGGLYCLSVLKSPKEKIFTIESSILAPVL